MDDDVERITGPGEVEHSLGHAEYLGHTGGEPVEDETRVLGAHAGAADLDVAQRRRQHRFPVAGLSPQFGQRVHQTGDGDRVLVDQREGGFRAGVGGEHRRRTHRHRAQQARACQREVVAGRQRDEIDVLSGHLAGLRARAGVVEVVVVGAGDQLRQAGGAAGNEQQRRIVRVDGPTVGGFTRMLDE